VIIRHYKKKGGDMFQNNGFLEQFLAMTLAIIVSILWLMIDVKRNKRRLSSYFFTLLLFFWTYVGPDVIRILGIGPNLNNLTNLSLFVSICSLLILVSSYFRLKALSLIYVFIALGGISHVVVDRIFFK